MGINGVSPVIPDSGRVFIKHQANLPSGGHMAEIEIGVFLNPGKGPEHQELMPLPGSLVKETATPERKSLLAHCRCGCAVKCG
jgi:hypothetical protein